MNEMVSEFRPILEEPDLMSFETPRPGNEVGVWGKRVTALNTEAFPQELTNYMEEVSSHRIPPMVYIDGSNPENRPVKVT